VYGFETSRALGAPGVLVAAVALVGTTVLGWRWGDASHVLPMVVGVGAAAVAVFATLRGRRS